MNVQILLVFAGHAYIEGNPEPELEDRNVNFVSVLVIQTDW
jgi:hypothetical protein